MGRLPQFAKDTTPWRRVTTTTYVQYHPQEKRHNFKKTHFLQWRGITPSPSMSSFNGGGQIAVLSNHVQQKPPGFTLILPRIYFIFFFEILPYYEEKSCTQKNSGTEKDPPAPQGFPSYFFYPWKTQSLGDGFYCGVLVRRCFWAGCRAVGDFWLRQNFVSTCGAQRMRAKFFWFFKGKTLKIVDHVRNWGNFLRFLIMIKIFDNGGSFFWKLLIT